MTATTEKRLCCALVVLVALTFAGAWHHAARAQNKSPDAAAAAPTESSARPGMPDRLPKVTADCEFFRTIYDWRALDPYNLIVWFNNRNTPRHIELETACYQLRFVDTIAFTSRDNRLCAFGGDSVIVGDEQCKIGALNKITPEEARALIAKYEKGRSSNKDAADKADESTK